MKYFQVKLNWREASFLVFPLTTTMDNNDLSKNISLMNVHYQKLLWSCLPCSSAAVVSRRSCGTSCWWLALCTLLILLSYVLCINCSTLIVVDSGCLLNVQIQIFFKRNAMHIITKGYYNNSLYVFLGKWYCVNRLCVFCFINKF